MKQLATDHRDFPDASMRELAHIPGKIGAPFLGMTPWLVQGLLRHVTATPRKIRLGLQDRYWLSKGGAGTRVRTTASSCCWTQSEIFPARWGIGIALAHGLATRFCPGTSMSTDCTAACSRAPSSLKRCRDTPRASTGLSVTRCSGWEGREEIVFMPFIKELLMNIGAKIFYGIHDLGDDAAHFSEAFQPDT